jgi:hypothetical protein
MLLDLLVARVRRRVKAKALVGTLREIFVPPIPLPGIVWESGRSGDISEHRKAQGDG